MEKTIDKEKTQHVSVMLDEVVEALEIKEGDCVVDATLGGGGYTKKLREIVGKNGHVISIDKDESAIQRMKIFAKEQGWQNITLLHSDFRNIGIIVNDVRKGKKVDAVVADLGVSSDQINNPLRGFSFMTEGPIDMRMDTSQEMSANEIVNTCTTEDLKKLIATYGDEPYAKRIADAIVSSRPLSTTIQLAQAIKQVVPRNLKSKIHPATKTFQALRIAVNKEYEGIEEFLDGAVGVLKKDGILVIVSFHSGEDHIVKNVMRNKARGCICPPELPQCVCKKPQELKIRRGKPQTPKEDEVKRNPRARSAKMRVAQKV